MFAGKTVIITGSSSGIGAHATVEFAKQKANVILHGRNEDNLKEVKKDCASAGGIQEDQVAYVVGDICSQDVQNALVNTALEKFKRIDVLVNNAGLTKDTLIDNANLDNYDLVMNVNLRSVVSLTAKCIPHLKANKGSIVNVSSIASTKQIRHAFAYCCSKAALDAYTKNAAAELAADGVRVNSVNPGPIPTNILRDVEVGTPMPDLTVPLQRWGTTAETSAAILFLASDQASYTTGQMLLVDGGMCIIPLA